MEPAHGRRKRIPMNIVTGKPCQCGCRAEVERWRKAVQMLVKLLPDTAAAGAPESPAPLTLVRSA
jgi:hypothetical protein